MEIICKTGVPNGRILNHKLTLNREGSSPGNRWKWNETIGPVENRPGRQGDWGYPNTDALGILAFRRVRIALLTILQA